MWMIFFFHRAFARPNYWHAQTSSITLIHMAAGFRSVQVSQARRTERKVSSPGKPFGAVKLGHRMTFLFGIPVLYTPRPRAEIRVDVKKDEVL